jgi:hypothetical protein
MKPVLPESKEAVHAPTQTDRCALVGVVSSTVVGGGPCPGSKLPPRMEGAAVSDASGMSVTAGPGEPAEADACFARLIPF